jgi:hypothetical protein
MISTKENVLVDVKNIMMGPNVDYVQVSAKYAIKIMDKPFVPLA